MNQSTWSAVDNYFCDTLIPTDTALTQALLDSDAVGLPQHHVAPNQGKFLHLLVKMQGARKILEIETVAKSSTDKY
ncbi:hypothetical protein ACO0LM_24105 [Undibacterium sp. Di26W]|uniref:hypothetical protein n=1 Tax=Undibacterium sp. Di26W TaxID=3413035 RepID=UPI003BF0BC22